MNPRPPMKVRTIRFPDALWDEANELADVQGDLVSEVLREALVAYVRKSKRAMKGDDIDFSRAGELRALWRDSVIAMKVKDSQTNIDAEQVAYDKLVDYVEAHDLNYSEFDPRGPRSEEEWAALRSTEAPEEGKDS